MKTEQPVLWDTHAHLQDQAYAGDLETVLTSAADAGVRHIATIGDCLAASREAVALAGRHAPLVAAAGIHPHHASEWNADCDRELETMLRGGAPAVAVGEIGLDYHYDFAPREAQHAAFEAQLDLGRRLGMPFVIHCREAADDLLAIVRASGAGPRGGRPAGVMHCFFGNVRMAATCIDMGFLLGIGGSATFKNAHDVHDVVRHVGLEHLVLETDCPYMAPIPHRGRRNEPAWVRLVAERVAQLKELPVEEVAERTTLNAGRLFGLS